MFNKISLWPGLPRTFQRGQLITLQGTLTYREVEDQVKGTTFKHRIAEIHATSMKKLSKIEAIVEPEDGPGRVAVHGSRDEAKALSLIVLPGAIAFRARRSW